MSSDKYDDGPDPYTSPNSQILINKLGITDNDQFIEMEKDFSVKVAAGRSGCYSNILLSIAAFKSPFLT
ncbi:hypothetical protein [Yersinia aleksiciae]|uniref:hypothetical protein n=1 Tax=Yersinia aleksiciae TaxID=263819 RepID=UPI0028F420FA|nr:hypothetical protein [Yersinia aleksiciae]WQC72436.1 hypothetical protein N0K21_08520 [Yersinia aleksiciae]